MHERAIALAIVRQVDEIRRQHGGAVRRVRLTMGALSGVDPLLLLAALRDPAADAWGSGIEIDWKAAPLELECGACGARMSYDEPRFACGVCGGYDTRIVGGEVVILESVDLEADSTPSAATHLPPFTSCA